MPNASARMSPRSNDTLHIVQGEYVVSDDPSVLISTLLGSCVAACMRDPVAGIGGMNHFLLPGVEDSDRGSAVGHGVHAMELLVNALLARGARRDRLEAKLFGGANLMKGLTDVGSLNALFAEGFLLAEGIANLGGSLRGNQGRRIQYWPLSGRARQVLMAAGSSLPVKAPPLASSRMVSGALELF